MSAAVERWRPLASAAAAKWSGATGTTVPVALVLAVIAQESRGDPAALRREPDGRISRGLMQVLEGTARELGLADPTQLHVPATGIDIGTHYLAKQLKRYPGNPTAAVAAYNAGTAKGSASTGYANQGYVEKVLGYYRQFAQAVGEVAIPTWIALAALLAGAGLLLLSRRRRRGLRQVSAWQ